MNFMYFRRKSAITDCLPRWWVYLCVCVLQGRKQQMNLTAKVIKLLFVLSVCHVNEVDLKVRSHPEQHLCFFPSTRLLLLDFLCVQPPLSLLLFVFCCQGQLVVTESRPTPLTVLAVGALNRTEAQSQVRDHVIKAVMFWMLTDKEMRTVIS